MYGYCSYILGAVWSIDFGMRVTYGMIWYTRSITAELCSRGKGRRVVKESTLGWLDWVVTMRYPGITASTIRGVSRCKRSSNRLDSVCTEYSFS